MAIIVKHNPSGKHYILLGAGYGMWASARPNRLLGDLFAADRNGQSRLLCLCDEQGGVEWAYAERVSIVSVDGLSPSQVLGGFVQPEDAG